jgi:general secretion pathway protein L
MPGKILGLQIDSDAVAAVVVKSGFRETRILGCGRVVIGEGGFDEALGALTEAMDLQNDATVVSVPAGKASLHTIEMPFSDPKKIRQALPYEMETLMPFSVESRVTDFITPKSGSGAGVLAASVSSETISEILACLRSRGLDAQVLDLECVPTVNWLLRQQDTPDTGLFLHIGLRRHTLVLFIGRQVALVRSLGSEMNHGNPFGVLTGVDGKGVGDPQEFRRGVEQVLATVVQNVLSTVRAFKGLSGFPISVEKIYFSGPGGLFQETGPILERYTGFPAEALDVRADKTVHIEKTAADAWNSPLMSGALALTMRDSKDITSFDFRKGVFEVETPLLGSLHRLKSTGVLVGLFLILWMADAGLEFNRLNKQYDALGVAMEEVFRDTFPDASRIVDPLQQMKVRAREDAGSGHVPGRGTDTRILDLIKEISARIPVDLNVRITVMTIDQDTVRLSGRTSDFNMVDGIKNSLEPSGYFNGVTITSANMDRSGKHVQFELRLQRAKDSAA